MTTTDVALPDGAAQQLQLNLGDYGYLTKTALIITDAALSFETWTSLARDVSDLRRASDFYIGDLLNAGEDIFGEAFAQVVEPTAKDRYDLASRVFGLEPSTLTNIASTCRRVPPERRREELTLAFHAEVAKLDPEEQSVWLERCIDSGWTRNELRDAIKAALAGGPEPDAAAAGTDAGRMSPSEQLLTAAQLVVRTWQSLGDGGYRVPPESAAQLIAALGAD